MSEKPVQKAQVLNAIDHALDWVAYALILAGLGGFAYFAGYMFFTGLPVVWDGGIHMWQEIFLVSQLVLVAVLIIALIRNIIPGEKIARETQERAAQRVYNRLFVVVLMIIGLGLNGFFPDDGVTWKMPLWLGVVLTGLGGVGYYYWLRLGSLTGLNG